MIDDLLAIRDELKDSWGCETTRIEREGRLVAYQFHYRGTGYHRDDAFDIGIMIIDDHDQLVAEGYAELCCDCGANLDDLLDGVDMEDVNWKNLSD